MSGRLGLRKKKKERGKTGENHDTGRDWEQWLASVGDVEEEERLVAEAQETAKAWVDSLVGDVEIAPK